jgi:serine/threonine protein phosphatase 1
LKRTIIFGDIHGCYEEWKELLKLIEIKKDDSLISVGDLIFKGPESAKCLDLAMTLPNLKCVLGIPSGSKVL